MAASIRGLSIGLIVIGLSISLARAEDRDQIKHSFKALTTALENGDGTTAKAYVIDTASNQGLAESLARLLKSAKEFNKAAVARFGKKGDRIDGGGTKVENLPYLPDWSKLDDTRIVIDNDTATIPPKIQRGLSVTFEKQGGKWKLAIGGHPDTSFIDNKTKGYVELTGDTERGKYGTPEELERAFARMIWWCIKNS